MQWKFFLGACFLTGAVLLPHARTTSVIAGMLLAGAVQLASSRIVRRLDGHYETMRRRRGD